MLDAMRSGMQETQYQKRTDDRVTDTEGRMLLNTEGLIRTILDQRLNGEEVGRLVYFFHEELARQITEICVRIREKRDCNKAALSGGVFQNRLLLELVDEGLHKKGFQVLKHSLIPPNDGGIALGQAAYGMAYLNRNTR